MALRVVRGLFRLWLLLSVLWIGGVGATTWWTLPLDLCATPPGGLHGCDANDVIAAGPNVQLLEKEANSKPEFDPSKPYRIPFDDLRRTQIKFGVVSAVLPPNLCAGVRLSIGLGVQRISVTDASAAIAANIAKLPEILHKT